MALEKPIIKSAMAAASTFDYKPRDLGNEASQVAKSFVDQDAFRSVDFKISELVAKQAGISQLESEAHQDRINALVLEQLKGVQEKAYEEGYELGLIEGTEKAFKEAQAAFVERLKAFEELLKRMEELKGRMFVDNESALIQLVFHTAKKMALRELQGHHEAVREILQHVVGDMQENERVVVRLSAEDMTFIETLQQKSDHRLDSLKRVKFVSDASITSGGCLIDTEYGSVDATVEERVERTWQTMASRVPQNPPPSAGEKE